MKYITPLIGILFISIFFYNCQVAKKSISDTTYFGIESTQDQDIRINVYKGEESNHPTYAIWTEDMEGIFLKTLFVTQSYANGIFGHQMVGDSIWLKTSGPSFQPAALPYWSQKKGIINGKTFIPTPENPYLDGFSGATPSGNLILNTKSEKNDSYRILLEVNQPWDWNKFWTNNKYPDSEAYKHSAQPSLIYGVTINGNHKSYHMNPIGHGDPLGESAKLFTDISQMDTALEIFDRIVIENIEK